MEYKPKILIVDDRPENLFTLENVLKGVDAEIIKAGNGNDALIATLNHELAVAILDVQMPDMDGYELAEILRYEEDTKYLPIIFLSAVFSDDFHVFKGYESGAVDFITKPFKPDILLSKVRIFMELDYRKVVLEKHKQSLLKSNALMRSVMESPKGIGIFALDENYCYVDFNRNHKDMMKQMWGQDIAIGMSKLDIIGKPDIRERETQNFDRALSGETFIIIELCEDESLSSCRAYYESHYNPIVTDTGEVIGLTVFLTDITKRKETEDALVRSKEKAEKERETAEAANKKVMDSIRYAQMIQSSLLPNPENIQTFLPDSFYIWMPRDIVGGDFIFTDCFEEGFNISVIDCTGHGVPGAFMTMIASFGLRKIIGGERYHEPAQILRRLNFLVKTTLQQDTEYALSDDGLDAAICFVDTRSGSLTFSGARLPLIYVHKGELTEIRGDRQSVGYKRSDLNYMFTNQTVKIERGMSFYMFSDGFVDQPGGEKNRRFGTHRFRELLRENYDKPFDEQREILLEAFKEYRRDAEPRDDVTVLGFGFGHENR
ncbi:MAG: hypothetical protein B6245_11670 [Desulfobacteraceae bacterium 4572_88]|nr:MAG: hypothetical protein B6245_11670 [Desulfobacteraceae bacterium 4572_88]